MDGKKSIILEKTGTNDESIELGKRLLQIELRRSDLELISFIRSESLLAIANQLGYEEPENMLQHIGEGELLVHIKIVQDSHTSQGVSLLFPTKGLHIV